MGVVGIAGVALNADTVGEVGPLVAAGGDGGAHVDDDFIGAGHFLGQCGAVGSPDLGNGFLADEQGGDPLGGAGFDEGHGQQLTGGGGGTVEHQVHHQAQRGEGQQNHGKQQQEEPADDPAQQTAALLFLLGLLHGSSASGVILGTIFLAHNK